MYIIYFSWHCWLLLSYHLNFCLFILFPAVSCLYSSHRRGNFDPVGDNTGNSRIFHLVYSWPWRVTILTVSLLTFFSTTNYSYFNSLFCFIASLNWSQGGYVLQWKPRKFLGDICHSFEVLFTLSFWKIKLNGPTWDR